MKTKASIALASAALGIAVFLAGNTAGPTASSNVKHSIQKSTRPVARAHSVAAPISKPEPEIHEDRGESANLAGWQARFNSLLQHGESSDEALRLLLAEMDAVFGNWVASQIAPLAELPPGERYDRLAEIEIAVQEGAAAILDLLDIEGSRHVSVLAGPLEEISAEIQYAESAPDHASRMAMLHLDQERDSRLEKLLAITGEPAKTQAAAELEIWYDSGLGAIFTPGGE
jgi:hypothetical protein